MVSSTGAKQSAIFVSPRRRPYRALSKIGLRTNPDGSISAPIATEASRGEWSSWGWAPISQRRFTGFRKRICFPKKVRQQRRFRTLAVAVGAALFALLVFAG